MTEIKFLRIDGAQIAYCFDGPDDAPILLFSNSLMTNFTMWDSTLPYLKDRFKILKYDIRGQGLSSASNGPYSMTQLSNDVLQIINFLNIEKINFVGLSLGGMIGQQFAIQYPNRLKSLVLCNTACEMPPKDLWNRCREIVLNEGMKGIAEDTLRYWFQPSFLRTNKYYPEVFLEMILRTDVQGYISCIEAIRDMDHTAMLSKIQTPTLIIAGSRDMACTVNQATILNRLIEKSELIILKNAAHISSVELPDKFSNTIISFINGIDASLTS